jgi:peptidoglycan hydrolase-like protein with peptidoglycan-binding domain
VNVQLLGTQRFSSVLFMLFFGSLAMAPTIRSGEDPPASSSTLMPNIPLAFVHSSEFIKGLQRELKRAGHDPGEVDGKMGPSTRQALKRFQEAHGLSTTGEADIPTLTKLLGQSLQR